MKEHKDTSWLPYMARTDNYNRWIFKQYKDHVGNSIMDIGCGYGTFVNFIKDKKRIFLLETSSKMIGMLKHKFRDYKNIKVIRHDLSKSRPHIIKGGSISSAICLNVMEHVKNDELMIKNIRQCLRTKGKLILYVPALKVLYGTLDIKLGHYRRYDKRQLENMLKHNGFRIIKSRYMNFLGFFSWFLYSRILKRGKVKEKRIMFYDKWLIPLISKFEDFVNPHFGQSLLVIAEAK